MQTNNSHTSPSIGRLIFRAVSIQSCDAVLLIDELNQYLRNLIGNDGSKHVNPKEFSMHRSVFLVGYDRDMPICCAGIRKVDEHTGEIKRVYARPNHIGAGVQLLAALEEWALAHNYTRLILECRTANAHAIAFYHRNGYSVCAQYPPYVGVADAVCMDKALVAHPSHQESRFSV